LPFDRLRAIGFRFGPRNLKRDPDLDLDRDP
jgi:hypothetical protein